MSKQSSVDFLWDELKGFISDGQYAGIMEMYLKAKEMHKRELSKALDVGYQIANKDVRFKHIDTTEQYYNETFGGDNE